VLAKQFNCINTMRWETSGNPRGRGLVSLALRMRMFWQRVLARMAGEMLAADMDQFEGIAHSSAQLPRQ
jgi:hypothetical protein